MKEAVHRVLFVQKVNVFLMEEIPAVAEILEAVEEIHIRASVRGELLRNLHRARNFIV